MGVGGQQHATAALPPGKTRYPLYRRLGRLQGRSGRVRKISRPPGFDPRTVQPVASRYTDWAVPVSSVFRTFLNYYGTRYPRHWFIGAHGKSICCSWSLTYRLFRGLPKCTFVWGFPVKILYVFIISSVPDAYLVCLLLFYRPVDLWKNKLLITKLLSMQFSPSASYFQIQALPLAAPSSATSSVHVLRLDWGPEFDACTDKQLLCYMLIRIILNWM